METMETMETFKNFKHVPYSEFLELWEVVSELRQKAYEEYFASEEEEVKESIEEFNNFFDAVGSDEDEDEDENEKPTWDISEKEYLDHLVAVYCTTLEYAKEEDLSFDVALIDRWAGI